MDENGNPNYTDSKFVVDWAERILWTGAQAALAAVSFSEFDLPLWSLPIIAAGLSALKGFVAKMVGNPDSASTAPSV
jgi:hypothetical protein